MQSTVYFHPLSGNSDDAERAAAGRSVLEALIGQGGAVLEEEIPIKLHFGEKGNRTYLKPAVYDGIADLFEERGIRTCFMETSVLYGGERFEASRHRKLAEDHGFTRLPVVIADGDHGELSADVPVAGGRHFRSAAIAEKLAAAPQVLVAAHFKGHMLAGFGGALKQLSMGFASKGGKMAMHLTVKPHVRRWKCRHCRLCLTRCNAGAIFSDGKKVRIDPAKCVGCGACFSICPHHAVSVFSFGGIRNILFGGRMFREKLAEYAYAAHHGKRNLYINFAADIVPGCDCEPRRMSPCVPDIGVFASLDPVAVDAACYDAVAARGKRFRGHEQIVHAAHMGVGSAEYTLVEV